MRPRTSSVFDQILLLLIVVSPSNGYIRSNRCYSCMSAIYRELFVEQKYNMGRYFFRPRNFTDQCNHPINPVGIGFVVCRTICLTLTQDVIVMGRKTGRQLVIRGCSTRLNRFGFFNRTMSVFDRYDICRDVKASDLFRYETNGQTVNVCSCLGDRCNGGHGGNGSWGSGMNTPHYYALLVLVMQIPWRFTLFWRR